MRSTTVTYLYCYTGLDRIWAVTPRCNKVDAYHVDLHGQRCK